MKTPITHIEDHLECGDADYVRFLKIPERRERKRLIQMVIRLTTKEPEKLASSLESRAKWAAAIGNAGAAFSTKQTTATVRAPDGSTSTATITEPDKDAQQSAAEIGRRQQAASGIGCRLCPNIKPQTEYGFSKHASFGNCLV